MKLIDIYMNYYIISKEYINNIINSLNIDGNLNVFSKIDELVSIYIKMLKITKDFDAFNEDNLKKCLVKNKEIKNLIIEIKNKQIYLYNQKVQEVNFLIDTYNSNNNQNVELLEYCNVYIDKDWKKKNYYELINLELLEECYKKYYDKNLNITFNNKLSYCIDMFKDIIKNKSNYNDTLNKCNLLYKYVIDSTFYEYYKFKVGESLLNDILDLELEICKKNCKDKYKYYKKILDIYFSKVISIDNIIDKNIGMFNKDIIEIFISGYINDIKKKLSKLNFSELNQNNRKKCDELLNNIDNYIEYIVMNKLKDYNILNNILNINIYTIKNNIELKIKELRDKINSYGDKITSIDHIKEILGDIDNINMDIDILKMYIIKFENNVINIEMCYNEVEKVKNIFYDRCPYLVKKIKAGNKMYKTINKDNLVISGYAMLSLLHNHDIISIIVDCNIKERNSINKEFIDSVNMVLCGYSNIKIEDNKLFDSNNKEIDRSVLVAILYKELTKYKISFDKNKLLYLFNNLGFKDGECNG